MSASEDKAKLLQAIHALGLPQFRAAELVRLMRPALEEYFGDHRGLSAIRVGMALQKILGQQHEGLKLQGQHEEVHRLEGRYNKSLRTWRFRVIDTKAPPKQSDPAPIVVKVTKPEPAESIYVDDTGKIHREFLSQNPLNPHSSNESVEVNPMPGIWERNGDGTLRFLGDRWVDGVALSGYPGGLHAGIDAMEQTARLAGAPRKIRALTEHQRACLILGCDEDTFC